MLVVVHTFWVRLICTPLKVFQPIPRAPQSAPDALDASDACATRSRPTPEFSKIDPLARMEPPLDSVPPPPRTAPVPRPSCPNWSALQCLGCSSGVRGVALAVYAGRLGVGRWVSPLVT